MNTFIVLKNIPYFFKSDKQFKYIQFLCQLNSPNNFLKLNDFSHYFILELPVCYSCKIPLIFLSELMSEPTAQKYFEKLLDMIDFSTKFILTGPIVNQQPIIECYLIPYFSYNDYLFLLELNNKYQCLSDFDILPKHQYFQAEYQLNIGNLFNFNNINKSCQDNFEISCGNYKSSNLKKYSYRITNNNKDYFKKVKSFWEQSKIFNKVESNEIFWSTLSFDINYSNNNDNNLNPLISETRNISCAFFYGSKLITYHFVLGKKNNDNNFYFHFDNELNLINSFFLFSSKFNQIVDFNSLKYNFLVIRRNVLNKNLKNINSFIIKFPLNICTTYNYELKCSKCKNFDNKCNISDLAIINKNKNNFNNPFPLSIYLDLSDSNNESNICLNSEIGCKSFENTVRYWFKIQVINIKLNNKFTYILVKKNKYLFDLFNFITLFYFDNLTKFTDSIDVCKVIEKTLINDDEIMILVETSYKIKTKFNQFVLVNDDFVNLSNIQNIYICVYNQLDDDHLFFSRNQAILKLYLSQYINKDNQFHHTSEIFNCSKYESYSSTKGKISNFLLTFQNYNHIIYSNKFSRSSRYIYYILCCIEAKKTNENDIDQYSTIYKNKRIYFKEAANLKKDFFLTDKPIYEEYLNLINEDAYVNFDQLSSVIDKFVIN